MGKLFIQVKSEKSNNYQKPKKSKTLSIEFDKTFFFSEKMSEFFWINWIELSGVAYVLTSDKLYFTKTE